MNSQAMLISFFILEKIVNTLGKQKAIDLYNKTKDIEQKGGYLTLVKNFSFELSNFSP